MLASSRRAAAACAVVLAVSSFVHLADAGETHAPASALRPLGVPERMVDATYRTFVVRAEGETLARPAVVYLHGINGRPEHGCGWFAMPALGNVLCPAATRASRGGTFSWSGGEADLNVVDFATMIAGGSGPPPLLVGFSQGAYVAARLMPRMPGRFSGAVLIGADVKLDPAALTAAGITRVALVAGDHDAASAPMKRTHAALVDAGFSARFTSLGRVGHTYVPESQARLDELRAAMAWAAGAGHAPAGDES